MPTFNQLVRQGRCDKVYKSKSPVLQKGFNTLRNEQTDQRAPQRRGVCTKVSTTQDIGPAGSSSDREGIFYGSHRSRSRQT